MNTFVYYSERERVDDSVSDLQVHIHPMMSMTTKMEPPAKKQRCSLKPSTIEALEEERAEPIEIGK